LEAEITLQYGNSKVAEAIADAVSPDNFKTPEGLTVKTERKEKSVITRITCRGSLATLIATLDDLLSCASTAENTLKTAKRLR
jgi:hypothetical protein